MGTSEMKTAGTAECPSSR